MKIDISDILSCEDMEATKSVPVGLMSFASKLGDFPITEKKPLEVRIANRQGSSLELQTEVALTVVIPCSRCLKEVSRRLRFSIYREFPIVGGAAGGDALEDDGFLEGTLLDIDQLVYGEMLAHWPTKVLCREDCKGLCKVCGQDLNEGTCGCGRTVPDPRMAAIQDIFHKVKEV